MENKKIDYKDERSLIKGLYQKFTKESKKNKIYSARELSFLFGEKLREFNYIQKKARVELKGWKGKSGIEIINHPEIFEIITFQKADQDSKPKEQRYELSKKEVNDVISILNRLDYQKNNKYWKPSKGIYQYPSRDVGEFYFEMDWDTEIFCVRRRHKKINFILRVLDYYGIIGYRGGNISILKKVCDIQTVL